MWRQDTLASNGIMQFAETGISSDLDQESQGYKDIFDIFSLPKIDSGLGETLAYIFVDNVHPLVKTYTRTQSYNHCFSLAFCMNTQR